MGTTGLTEDATYSINRVAPMCFAHRQVKSP